MYADDNATPASSAPLVASTSEPPAQSASAPRPATPSRASSRIAAHKRTAA
ncbi:hypothetical protein PC111_g23995 [Phytophthora cactorum]|nr:hypothetical protein PC111_g23995 [Phytophthora cactorum]